jgi:hypothetical protein
MLDKLVLGFIADVMYLKGIICFDELQAIYDVKDAQDLGDVFERMMAGEFNVYKKGESYGTLIKA